MIDLSHLTEEEQEAIMTVLRRDADLKKAEEERVKKLEKGLHRDPQPDLKLKYLTGEWFYEVKSRRHTDKIHGSEIILASMKQGKAAGLDGSLRVDRSKPACIRGSDVGPPVKPPRYLETLQPQEINDAEKENRYSAVRSPKTPRHNPFNRASLIVVDHPENNCELVASRDVEQQRTDPISSPKSHSAGESTRTLGGSITSEGSSMGFRPVPKKRTFLSRRTNSQLESNSQVVAPVRPVGIVPAPRQRRQRGSNESSEQQSRTAEENLPQPLCSILQVVSTSTLELEAFPPSVTTAKLDASAGRGNLQKKEDPDDLGQTCEDLNFVSLHRSKSHDKENKGCVGTSAIQDDKSLPQSTMDLDLPVHFDPKFIDDCDQQEQMLNQKHEFKLTPQSVNPSGEEDSIAKVLDWFNRSTDSNDFLIEEDEPMFSESSARHVAVRKVQEEDLSARHASEWKKEMAETERSISQRWTSHEPDFRAAFRNGNQERLPAHEEAWAENRERLMSPDVKDIIDEGQPLKISNLKSFWEKSNTGVKILISKSVTPGEKEMEPAHLSAEKEADVTSGMNSGKETHEKYTSVKSNDRPATTNMGVRLHSCEESLIVTPTQRNNNDVDHLKLRSSIPPMLSIEDPETICVSNINSLEKESCDSESEILSVVKPKLQADSTPKQSDPTQQKRGSMPKLDTDLILYVDSKQGGIDVQIPAKAQLPRGSSEDVKRRDSEDKNGISNLPSKRRDSVPSKDRTNSPHLGRQALPHQESTAERIKQLKVFWEKEWNKPVFYTGKPKASGESRAAHGGSQGKLNKRFTKSEFDLRKIGNELGSDQEDGDRNHPNFSVLPFQRLDKLSPSLSASRMQFNTLREFWGEAASDSRGLLTVDKPKSPKRKESLGGQMSSPELKSCNSEIYFHNQSLEKTKAAVNKSTPASPNQTTPLYNRQVVAGVRTINDSKNNPLSYMSVESGQHRQSKRSSKESSRDEKSTKQQCSAGKEVRSRSSSRGSSMRRATSMFTLSAADDKEQLRKDVNSIHSQSRKHRQNNEKGVQSRKLSEEPETVAPRARAFVPTDYRHYLGMTDKSSVDNLLAPAVEDQSFDCTDNYELDLGGPEKASTPVTSEERQSRKAGKLSQRQAWANHSESDTGQESSLSSVSETWSNTNRENKDEDQNPVRKALRRAEARAKNLAKSMEDITSSPRQEKRQDPAIDSRRSSDVLAITPPSSSLFSDPDHLKKMSKSVPSFLQKELSGSVMTMYSGDLVEVQGNIHFSINYVQRLREFHIFVSECRDLAAVDPKRGRSDPYVKSYLVPDKANLGKRKTSVKKKTLNPTFNEILRYRVRMDYLQTQMLVLSVWHHDTFGRNSFLGEVDVDLSKWDFDHTQMNYLALKAKTMPTVEPTNGRGEMRLAIRFLPQISHSEGVAKDISNSGEIHIWVKDCKGLPLIRATIDPYVKCFVLPDTSRKGRQKTRVLRRTVDPVFNHTMVYDGISVTDLTEACVELTVWDRDRLASNLLGGVRLGVGTGRSYGTLVDWMDSGPYEVALWDRMMASPNEWVEGVLPLRMLNSAKTAFK
uniref:Synaptotagmin-like protein 2 n=1 Tax=Oryzias latipes TaxID=8090 RepID=A0A3P9KEL2_ORYLA